MSSHDFLHIHARTELAEDYAVAGFVFRLTTNHGALLECFRGTFPTTKNAGHVDFFFRFWIDDGDASRPPWPQPYVRGLVHRVYAGFDAKSSVFADLRARTMIGRFSPAMAEDAVHWKTIIFPVLMSIVSGSAGMVELHASCAAIDHRGIILLGPSRSGKSTLAMALLQSGLRLLSDDRIFCLLQNRDLAAFGLPRPLKLRCEAAKWFENLGSENPSVGPNGERVVYWDANRGDSFGLPTTCRPHALLFLEQQQDTAFRMIRLPAREARFRIEADLLAETPEAAADQGAVLDHLTSLPCWRLLYGGSPQSIAQRILEHAFDSRASAKSEALWSGAKT
jgi:hypothetical protein